MTRRWSVRYSTHFIDDASARFPVERGEGGALTFGEFMAGPVRAARLLFEADWDGLPPQAGDAVRTVHTFSPHVGPIVFYGVLVGPASVEIAGFDIDEDYWGSSQLRV